MEEEEEELRPTLGAEEREQDDVRGGGKGGSHAGAAGRSTRSRTKEAVEFEERQTDVGLPVGSSARVEDGQKKGGARQRLEPAEAQFQFQFQFAVPSPSSWSGLVSMDGWQAGKDW